MAKFSTDLKPGQNTFEGNFVANRSYYIADPAKRNTSQNKNC